MRFMDYVLRRWRFQVVKRYIPDSASLLDVGCFDGAFIAIVSHRITHAVGFDRQFNEMNRPRKVPARPTFFVMGDIAHGLPFADEQFDVVTMLAVYEHLEDKALAAREVARVLRRQGQAILTVPSHKVDDLLHLLIAVGLADGMKHQEHHGFSVEETAPYFEACGLTLVKRGRFQFGLNNLFVFVKSRPSASPGDTRPSGLTR